MQASPNRQDELFFSKGGQLQPKDGPLPPRLLQQQKQLINDHVSKEKSFQAEGSDSTNTVPKKIRHYSLEDFSHSGDRSQMSNFDRFMQATLPVKLNLSEHTLLDLVRAYHEVSLSGLTVDLHRLRRLQDADLDEHKQSEEDGGALDRQFYTFIPTLSSLYLLTNSACNPGAKSAKPAVGQSSNDRLTENSSSVLATTAANTSVRKSKVIEFHESQKVYQRKPLSLSMLEECQALLHLPSGHKQTSLSELLYRNDDLDTSFESDESPPESRESFMAAVEADTNVPGENSPSEAIEQSTPPIAQQINLEHSWFSVLWTCQSVRPTKQAVEPREQSLPSMQFLVAYKFDESKQADGPSSDVKVVGNILVNNPEHEDYWVQPVLMRSDSNMEGQLFDETFESNRERFHDLRQQAIDFMRDGSFENDSSDYQHCVKALQQDKILPNETSDRGFIYQQMNAQQLLEQMETITRNQQARVFPGPVWNT